MKEFRFRGILIIAAVAIAVYLLYPTYVDYQNTEMILDAKENRREMLKAMDSTVTSTQLDSAVNSVEDSIKIANPDILETRQKRIKLGLDLQGGMRIVLEVNTGKLLERIAKNQDDDFRRVLRASLDEAGESDEAIVDIFVRRLNEENIRLSKYFGTIRDDDQEIIDNLQEQTEDAVKRAQEILTTRIDKYGVAEPLIQRQGDRRIIVELPGVANEEEARQLIQATALLEFKLVKDPQVAYNIMEKIDGVLAGNYTEEDTTAAADTTLTGEGEDVAEDTEAAGEDSLLAGDTLQLEDTLDEEQPEQLTEEEFKKEHPFFAVARLEQNSQTADAFVRADERAKVEAWLQRPDVQKVIPNDVEFLFSAKPAFTSEDGIEFYRMILVNKEAELTGGVITEAVGTIDPSSTSAIVTMAMNSEGSTEWARITGANVDKRVAIVLDGVVFSSPYVRGKIIGGRSQIEGMENLEEAQNLAIILNAGAFSAPVEIIEERTVGPSLGQDSVSQGFQSAMLGFVLVAFFMIFWYRTAGGFATMALVFTILFILGILAFFKATLTLPGIAGVVLTIGMAVDANVLIFERIREELSTGKTLKASVDGGFTKAYSAIWDSNITTFFTGIILYNFGGTGPVQGFALTLMIGIGSSLFSALIINKLMFDFMVHKNYKISIG